MVVFVYRCISNLCFVTCHVLCFLWIPGRVAAVSEKSNGETNKQINTNISYRPLSICTANIALCSTSLMSNGCKSVPLTWLAVLKEPLAGLHFVNAAYNLS
jgi:hypothetical protein